MARFCNSQLNVKKSNYDLKSQPLPDFQPVKQGGEYTLLWYSYEPFCTEGSFGVVYIYNVRPVNQK